MDVNCTVNGTPMIARSDGFIEPANENLSKSKNASSRMSTARALYKEFAGTEAAKGIRPSCATLTDVWVVFRQHRFNYTSNGDNAGNGNHGVWKGGPDDPSLAAEYVDSIKRMVTNQAKYAGTKYLRLANTLD